MSAAGQDVRLRGIGGRLAADAPEPEGSAAAAPPGFSWSATVLKVAFRLSPRVPSITMIATDTRAAIRPYSIAVAPLSSLTNLRNMLMERSPMNIGLTHTI